MQVTPAMRVGESGEFGGRGAIPERWRGVFAGCALVLASATVLLALVAAVAYTIPARRLRASIR